MTKGGRELSRRDRYRKTGATFTTMTTTTVAASAVVIASLAAALLGPLVVVADDVLMRDCHSTDPRPYVYHATKTPYELINNEDSSLIFVPGCQPVMFWMVARHGTQYPPSDLASRIKDRLPVLRKMILQNHKEKRGTLCQQDVDALSNHGTLRIDDNQNEALTSTGKEELLVLARRYRGRFAEFFNTQPTFNENDYQFRHVANSMASMASARSFSRGIFPHQQNGGQVRLTEAPVGDRLVHFYDNCTLWKANVDQDPQSEREAVLFRSSGTFQRTLADVTKRLGFQYNMSADDMLLIYDACRYQKAWDLESTSPWCAAFTADNLKVLEFGEDIQTYYKQGYGHELNYRQACSLVEDLVKRIRVFKANGTSAIQERGLFYFTGEEGLLRFVSRLGLFKDEKPLSHEDSPSDERKWRTSLMGSFAANVAVVVYECQGQDLKVQVFAKEDRVHLDACRNALCTAKEFLDAYGHIADECSRRDGCDPNAASVPRSSLNAFVLVLALFHVVTSMM